MTIKPLYPDSHFKRIKEETEHNYNHRSEFRRDFTRLLHSPNFRRLQGKTQLFPSEENDFFRTRLTHSLEVAQIAHSIANKLNHNDLKNKYIELGANLDTLDHAKFFICTDLVEFAALGHDIGHPPFGHTGEYALDEIMAPFGGFEGNAQTIRIITRLIKRKTLSTNYKEFEDCGTDKRLGINATYRSIAALLKYDKLIPNRELGESLQKGYYETEKEILDNIKTTLGVPKNMRLSTIESQIMDLADDIAYTCYDLEDAMKAGLTTPSELLNKASDKDFVFKIAMETLEKDPTFKGFTSLDQIPRELNDAVVDRISLVVNAFQLVFKLFTNTEPKDYSQETYKIGEHACKNGYVRSNAISDLVASFIDQVTVEYNAEHPFLSKIIIPKETLIHIEALKKYNFKVHILSFRLRSIEFRGKKIAREILQTLLDDSSNSLMPEDWRHYFQYSQNANYRKRMICDFVANMTDNYAIMFHDRLHSTSSISMFKSF